MTTTQTFLLPDLGEGLTEAEVVRWLVSVGDVVTVDMPIAEVETAKSLVEVPTPYAGVVEQLHGDEGSTIDVGTPLITIGVPVAAEVYREEEKAGSGNVLIGYGTAEGAGSARRRKPRMVGARIGSTAGVSPAGAGQDGAVVASKSRVPLVISPLVRRLARDAQVDLRKLSGSGAGGLIVRRDVELAIAQRVGAEAEKLAVVGPHASTADGFDPRVESAGAVDPRAESAGGADARTGLPELRRTGMSGFRKAVAATLSRSRAEIPEATTWVDVDATALVELRESLRTATDPGPGLLALMARFVIAGLRKYPELNGFVDGEDLVQYDGVNLGLAAQTDRGLVVPAVASAHTLTTRQLDAEIRRLTESARDGRLTQRELSCGTFTLNNYGSFGVDGSAAIINHPQVAILGVGRIIDRPWVVDGELAIRKLTQLSLVFDHRVCDGGTAAGFLRFVADAFERPASVFADL
ncbi:pyruvate dehydrogenase E2 component (dihydrolipoamide acetyltransferase) [Kribbella sp. VKM Ac-2527]|uniref:Dihydrolipoamide acetyltransferase component of pyruvate dehydrogenase complex n=1 Tax=Kribbella caucasensis TaxID=2512215 RepID=A0A4V3CB35_9ACTN|nr:dihydrolipoamide acetyltransferase family protein [Kribbella sp. VKM Ac-2527]TDO54360.1 pyruvate dehydrogenase E2 component (dihydrolipoamide acetyltransferase) [Kribbella sp. VKM Ac-2527]